MNKAKQNVNIKKSNIIDNKVRNSKPQKLKFSFKEQQEYNEIDQVIADLELELSQIKVEIEQKSSSYELLSKLILKKDELERMHDEKTERWIYLNELAEKIENP